jgi:hypothetical protein
MKKKYAAGFEELVRNYKACLAALEKEEGK